MHDNDEKVGSLIMNLAWFAFAVKFLIVTSLISLAVLYFMEKPLWYAPIIAVVLYIIYRLILTLILTLIGHTSEKQVSAAVTPYDPNTQIPVLRASICNGEKIAGFKDKKTGHFTEIKLIRSDADLAEFKRKYCVEEITTEY